MDDDTFHSGSKPMEHLKGGMESPHTQAPATSEAMTNPRSASVGADGPDWDAKFRAPQPALSSSNDKNKAH